MYEGQERDKHLKLVPLTHSSLSWSLRFFLTFIFSHLLTVLLTPVSLLLRTPMSLHSGLFLPRISVIVLRRSAQYVAQWGSELVGSHSVLTGCEFHRNSIKKPLKNNAF